MDNHKKPTGTVTFLFTDIEGSTELWETRRESMQPAFERQESIIRQAMDQYGGYTYKMIGDAFQVAFDTASKGLQAAMAAQKLLCVESWGDISLKVRMALHTGVTDERKDDYVGPVLNRIARLMSAGYGGQILLTQATADLVSDDLPENVSLLDLGQHRLKDLVRLEHIYQLCGPGLPLDFPPIKTLNLSPNNLPTQLTSFIGRETEIGEIKWLINYEQRRLVTLTGPGGTGKTRLALHIAADLLDIFPDGVWLVELASLADAQYIPLNVAKVFGLRESPNKPVSDSLVDFLRKKKLLLILDNCEHIIEACARLAILLLQSCSDLYIMATSREILGIAGEVPYRVPSLSVPDLRQLPDHEALSHFESIQLFVERAAMAIPGFMFTPANSPAIAKICSRLDGIPLAIELAAARIRFISVEQIATRLDDAFRLLTGGSRTVLPRHQTLRALIDWSYNLLSDREKKLFQRLTVFAGGWTLDAAEAICADDIPDIHTPQRNPGTNIETSDVLGLLSSLVDKSLVLVNDSNQSSIRYHLLETIRQYGHEKLQETGGATQTRSQHLHYYLIKGSKAEPHLRTRNQNEYLDFLDQEFDNIRQALEWSLYDQVGDGLLLATDLLWFWQIRGHRKEGIDWLERLLEFDRENNKVQQLLPEQLFLRGNALIAVGTLCTFHNFPTKGLAYLKESEALFIKAGKAGLRGLSICQLVQTNYTLDPDLIIEQLSKNLNIFQELGDDFYTAECLQGLGSAYSNRGQFDEAFQVLEEDLRIRIKSGDQDGMATAHRIMGDTAILMGNYSLAESYYQQCKKEYEAIHNILFVFETISALARLSWIMDDLELAQERAEQALNYANEFGSQRILNNSQGLVAYIALSRGDYQLAIKISEEIVEVAEEENNPYAKVNSLYIQLLASIQVNDTHNAKRILITILRTFPLVIDPISASLIMWITALWLAVNDQWQAAARLFVGRITICQWSQNILPRSIYQFWLRKEADTFSHLTTEEKELAFETGKKIRLNQAIPVCLQALE